jgi:hypothetical protein
MGPARLGFKVDGAYMRPVRTRRFPVVAILCAMATFAFSQGGPPGGGGGGTDSNPDNPANWLVTTTWLREDEILRYEEVSPGFIEFAEYLRSWPSPALCYRNGVEPPWSWEFMMPIVDYARLGQDSDWLAQYTVRVEWKGVGPAPESCRVVINSQSRVFYSNDGYGSVTNGLGGTVVTIDDEIGGYFGTTKHILNPMVVRTISIDPQTKVGTMSFMATASVSNPSAVEPGFIWTDMGADAWFDVRNAFIYGFNGQIPLSRVLTGDNVVATMHVTQDGMPMPVTNHAFTFFDNLDQAYNGSGKPRTFTFPEAVGEEAEIIYGADFTNYSSWHLGLPITPQNRFTLMPDGVSWREPDPIEYFAPFSFTISPAGNLLGSWSLTGRTTASGGANSLPSGAYFWDDLFTPPVQLQQWLVQNVFGQQQTELQSLHYEENEQSSTDTKVLTAVYTDGVQATSIRDIQYHPSLELNMESSKRWVDFEVASPYLTVPIGPTGGGFFANGIAPEDTPVALVYPQDFPHIYFYIDDALEATTIILGLIPVTPTPAKVILGLLKTGIDLAAQNLPEVPASATHVYRDVTYTSDICDSIWVHNFGYASWTQILEGQDREDWNISVAKAFLGTVLNPSFYWSARTRPGTEKRFRVYDNWGAGGFESRGEEIAIEAKFAGSDRFGFFYMSYAPTESGVIFP